MTEKTLRKRLKEQGHKVCRANRTPAGAVALMCTACGAGVVLSAKGGVIGRALTTRCTTKD